MVFAESNLRLKYISSNILLCACVVLEVAPVPGAASPCHSSTGYKCTNAFAKDMQGQLYNHTFSWIFVGQHLNMALLHTANNRPFFKLFHSSSCWTGGRFYLNTTPEVDTNLLYIYMNFSLWARRDWNKMHFVSDTRGRWKKIAPTAIKKRVLFCGCWCNFFSPPFYGCWRNFFSPPPSETFSEDFWRRTALFFSCYLLALKRCSTFAIRDCVGHDQIQQEQLFPSHAMSHTHTQGGAKFNLFFF